MNRKINEAVGLLKKSIAANHTNCANRRTMEKANKRVKNEGSCWRCSRSSRPSREFAARPGLGRDCRRITVLLVAALALALGLNALHPAGLPLVLSAVRRPGVPARIWKKLRFTDAKSASRTVSGDSNAVLVDVRDRKDYEVSHAAGAISLPYRRFDRSLPEFTARVSPGKRVLLYCYGTQCGLSVRVASRLVRRGYADVVIVKKGFEAWKAARLPVDSSNAQGQ